MSEIALHRSGLHVASKRAHIRFLTTDPISTSALPSYAHLAQVKHKRVYFP